MTVDERKDLYRRYLSALSQPSELDAVLAPNFVAYDLPEGQRDALALRRFRERVTALVPDQTASIDDIIAEEDRVAAHVTLTQTLPTGEKTSFSLMEMVRIADGRIASRRAMLDAKGYSLLQRFLQR